MKKQFLSIIIPLFNEVDNITELYRQLTAVLGNLSDYDYEILFVDDGSRDGSFEMVKTLHRSDQRVRGISFSRNFGHQTALLAGLEYAKGNIIISMDADLQHPPSLIPTLIEQSKKGYEIVNTRRLDSEGVGWFKKTSSKYYYSLLNYLSDIPIEPAAADFRLMTRKVVDAYLNLPERGRFTRGLVSWIGFKQTIIEYKANARFAGQSKYSLVKMLKFGLDGIIAFSVRPLRLSFYVGFLVFLFGILYAIYAIIQFFQGETVAGWASILVSVLIIGGVMLLSLGVIGEYIARIYHEVKQRPHYFIQEEVGKSI